MVLGYTLGPVSHTLLNESSSVCKQQTALSIQEQGWFMHIRQQQPTFGKTLAVEENANKKQLLC